MYECVCTHVCRGALPIGRGSDMPPKYALNCVQHTEACGNKTGNMPVGKMCSAATADQKAWLYKGILGVQALTEPEYNLPLDTPGI